MKKTKNPGDMYNAYKMKVAKKVKKTYTKTPVMTEALMKSAYEDARRNNRLGVGFGGEPTTKTVVKKPENKKTPVKATVKVIKKKK